MKIIKYRYGNKISTPPCVLALGFFDGVHLGHRELLRMARREATERGLSFGIFTFDSGGGVKPGVVRITDDERKAEIFDLLGADFTVFADFSTVSGLSAEEFVKHVLIDALQAEVAVAGFNYRFGKSASAGADELTLLMRGGSREAIICNEYDLDGAPVSTTRIREALSSGDVKAAGRLLGAPYEIKGRVIHGRGVGRLLGFPTVNTDLPRGSIELKRGVYRTAIPIGDRIYSALTNVGTCPTFDERALHLETYVLDFDGNLYDEELRIFFLDFLRDEKRFNSKEELIMQIKVDKNKIIKENGDISWQELGLK